MDSSTTELMSKGSDRVLRNIPRVDYREPEDDLSFHEQSDTLPVGDVNVLLQPNPSLNDISSKVAVVHDIPPCSIPINSQSTSLHFLSDSSVSSNSASSSGTVSPVEGTVSDQAFVNEELIETISRLSIASVCDSVSVSDTVSPVEDTLIADLKLIEEETSKIEMASALRKLAADLETILFQITEIHEEMNDVGQLSHSALTQMHGELKELRVRMVNVNKEIELAHDNEFNYGERVQRVLEDSKKDLRSLKLNLSSFDIKQEKIQAEKENSAKEEKLILVEQKRAEDYSKTLAFQRSVQEIEGMYASLLDTYSLNNLGTSRSEMLRRDKEKSAVAVEFNRMRDRIDKLILQTNANVDRKEETLDQLIKYVRKIETCKQSYENKIYEDLVDNDLTEDKLKLAEATKINIGKFSGRLDTGDDFYTFKSKFVKAYDNHPKSLMVEWLKNNHLEGHAKEVVGSLDTMDEIWVRLQSNFGNTELMLMFHFAKINKMGPMFRHKSFNSKKIYVQSLINVMQDVLDLATEHDLLGELNYGLQLGKVVGLLENQYQNGWYKVITEENVTKPHRWQRMIRYLNSKLSIIQIRAFESESAESTLPRDNKDNNKDKDHSKTTGGKGTTASPRVNIAKGLCNLCDQAHPNSNKSFFQCRKFLLMSCKARTDQVRKGKFCLQCLDGKTKFNDSNHECCDKWVCRHDSHSKYEKKLHFMLCEFHAEDEENKKLFERFKTEVLTAEWQQKIFKDSSGYFLRNSTFLGK